MNITDFIVDFIKQGNVVELPGIGTLTGYNVSAHHDAATGTYYPTRRTVKLTAAQSGNKAIVRGIAERECVTTEIAEQMWANFVGALDDKLRRNPAGHEFPGLGVMRLAGGRVAFTAVEGLDLDADKRREIPIENVAVFSPKQQEDPFAAFDKPAEIRRPEAEAQPEAATAPAEAQPAETQSAEAEASAPAACAVPEVPAPDKAALRAADREAKALAKEAAKAAKEREKAEKENRKKAEKAAKEAEKLKKEKSKHAEKAAQEKKKEAEKQRKAAEKAAKKHTVAEGADGEEKKKKKHGWLWVLLCLLAVVLLGGGAYCYLNYVKKPAKEAVAKESRLELPYYSAFSRDLNMLVYDESDIVENVGKIHNYVAGYIRAYLSARHYGNAYALFMMGIDQYAEDRLRVIMTDDCFAVQRFFPFNDYYYNYCIDELTETGKYVKRCIVQGEIFDTDRLDAYLDQLIAEKGLRPDGNFGAVPAAAPKKAPAKAPADYRPAEPSAPTLKASKQGFDIIAGFFTQRSSANKMTNNLKSLGCDAYVINRSGLYYVSMGSAPTYTAAQELERHIKSWYQGDTKIKNWNE